MNRKVFPHIEQVWMTNSRTFGRKSRKIVDDKLVGQFEEEMQIQQAGQKEKLLLRVKNKSGLLSRDQKILDDQTPLKDGNSWTSLTFMRRMYGIYGDASNISSQVVWPSVNELEDWKNLEKFLYPQSASKMIKIAHNEIQSEEAVLMKREKEVMASWKNLPEQIARYIEKEEVKRAASKALAQRSLERHEAVRRILGYKTSTSDPNFVEALAKMEEDDKNKKKQAKKLMKQQRERDAIAYITKQAEQSAMTSEE